jgi:hypothetical protein
VAVAQNKLAMFYEEGHGGLPKNIGEAILFYKLAAEQDPDYRGSRENLHLIERWTRTGPTSLEYAVTIEDPTVWTRPWIVRQEFTKQSDPENRVYYEPRCIEGNYALPGLLRGARMEELAFAQGRGPDPATRDNSGVFMLRNDPLQ